MRTALESKSAHLHLRSINAIGVYAFIAIGIVVAAFVPDNILENAWARSFVAVISNVVPFVTNIGKVSPIPQTAQFFSAVMWVLAFALASIGIYATLAGGNPREQAMRQAFQGRRLKMVAVLTIFTCGAVFIFFYPVDGHTRLVQLTTGSRAGLAAGGTISILVIPLWGMTVAMLFKYWGSLWNGPAMGRGTKKQGGNANG